MSSGAAIQRSVTGLGDRVLGGVEAFGDFALLAARTAGAAARPRFPWRATLQQFEAIAVRSTPIVVLTALFTGMVFALQTAFTLSRFGAKPYVGTVVGLAMVRELGPVLAALMVGGRVGAGIASELGAMTVTEQVDAIRAMGADPVQKLVLPRVVAATIGLPLLTAPTVVLAILGGLVVADLEYAIAPSLYLQTLTTTVTVADFFAGVSKTFFFGWIIAMVGCFVGLSTSGGTEGVGRAATRAVVVGSVGVLVSDFFLTKLLLLLPAEELLARIAGLLR